jgi:lipopolysaccharide transport system permease protein
MQIATMSAPPAALRPPIGPFAVARTLIFHRALISRMARREIVDRYRGSVLGLMWSFFHPVAMLLIYTFVFSFVLGTSWPGSAGGSIAYALNLFAGLIVYSLFSESVTRAPALIVDNRNLVKKVVFPLEILPWVSMLSSAFHALVSYGVLLVFLAIATRTLNPAALLVPVLVVPVMLLGLGLSWFLASMGVFLRDLTHTVGLAVTALMFLSPVFYPLGAIPEEPRRILALNPLAPLIEQARAMAVLGTFPDALHWLVLLVATFLVAWAGLWWFMRTKHAFADVV